MNGEMFILKKVHLNVTAVYKLAERYKYACQTNARNWQSGCVI